MKSFRSALAPFVAWVALLHSPPLSAADFGDGRVHLRGETYAVADGPSSSEPRTALAPDDVQTWIVPVLGPAGPDVRAALEAAGGRVVGTVPSNAYLVRAERSRVPALRRLAFVQRVDWLRPAWKVSPEIGSRTFLDPGRAALGSARLLEIAFFPGEDPDAVGKAVAEAGASVVEVRADPWGRHVLAVAEPGVIPAIAEISAVEWIEEPGELELRNDKVRWVIQSNQTDVVPLYDNGLLGQGEIIGHIDAHVSLAVCYFRDPVDNTPGPSHRKVVANRTHMETASAAHGIHTAGTAAGDREPVDGLLVARGMAPQAKLSLTNFYNLTGFGNSPSNLAQYLDLAHQDGARVHTNSWGETTINTYTSLSVDVDAFSRTHEEDLVVFAVANSAPFPGRVLAPENAKNCLAVAASDSVPSQDNHGRGVPGPTFDGRRKPEVNAPGVRTLSAAFSGCATTTMSGTSMAAPAVAGGAALVRQYFRRGYHPTGRPWLTDRMIPTGALLKAVVINSTVDMTGVTFYPSALEGWGRILLDDALYFPGDTRRLLVRDVRHPEGLSTGQTRSFAFRVSDSSEPLKITMAFMDEPATPLASLTPVNDLDLEVVGPDGTFLGNVFDTTVGVSVTGGSADVLNNVERVIVASPTPGRWTVHVRGAAVPMGPQGYAVAVNGGLFPAVPEGGPGPTEDEEPHAEVDARPVRLDLHPPSPSPFRAVTTVRLAAPERAEARVEVYDVNGRRVRTLLDRTVPPGDYRLLWDGRDDAGRPAAAGVYFVRLTAPGVTKTVRGVLLR
ncbi:MAG TPA: S8 family serine peptidase [bacterium]|nr:S8 family serine peptidase [bacterium]